LPRLKPGPISGTTARTRPGAEAPCSLRKGKGGEEAKAEICGRKAWRVEAGASSSGSFDFVWRKCAKLRSG